MKKAATAMVKSTEPKRMSWLLYVGIAIVLAVWTILGALFFLAVVWVMRQNPGSDSSFTLSDNEKKTARRIYTWLLLSPFIALPVFIISAINLSSSSTINERVLSALIPLIFHLPLLLGLTSKSAFVYRHSQQSILLMAIRASLAALALNLGSGPNDGLWLFLLGNGSLWLFGTMWGRNQVIRGRCWLMEQRGEKIISVESAKVDSPQMDKELEDMLKSLDAKDTLTAKTKALNAFRTGTPETKRRAVEILSKLGEVEEF